jgi:hypothetical protein
MLHDPVDTRAAPPPIEQVRAHAQFLGEFGDGFAGSQELHDLSLELLGVSFSGLSGHHLDFGLGWSKKLAHLNPMPSSSHP